MSNVLVEFVLVGHVLVDIFMKRVFVGVIHMPLVVRLVFVWLILMKCVFMGIIHMAIIVRFILVERVLMRRIRMRYIHVR